MATFTRTLWETGDTITADGLNGAKGGRGFLELTQEDEGGEGYDFEVSADLTFADLFGLVLQEGQGGILATEVTAIESQEGDVTFYRISFGSTYEFYYDPAAKKLMATMPPDPDDDGGGDIG